MQLTEKYRPKSFQEFLGNEDQLEILKNLLKKKEGCPKVFLFIGGHGCGKTTLAKIMAREVGAEKGDIIEINSSNNRGIDTAREIIDQASFMPLYSSSKVYIMDEVHKTTNDFQNAMLKILEDPPKKVFFMLCTTNPEKILQTVKSRSTIIKLEKADSLSLTKYMKRICNEEGKEVPVSILKQIAIRSEGHIRDSLKLLEKVFDCSDEEKMSKIIEKSIVGDDSSQVIDLCKALNKEGNWKEVREILKTLDEDAEGVRRAVMGYFSKVLLSSDNHDQRINAMIILKAFEKNFFDTGKVGLVMACFDRFN